MGPALAAAGASDATGREFILAAAAGYTLMGRVAAPYGPMQARGWMSSGFWGPGGGAATAARLMRLDAEETAAAISLGASAATGPFQYFYDQTEDRRLVVARAASSAVGAAHLARLGEHGAAHAYEGPAGLFKLADPKVVVDPVAIAANFSRLEGPLYLYPKFYSASSSILPTLEGFARLERAGQLPRSGISAVVLRESPVRGAVLAAKLAKFEEPRNLIGARMNYAFMTALYLLRGDAGPDAVTEATLTDADVIGLAREVTFEPIDDSMPASVVVRYRDGRQIVVPPNIIDITGPAPFAAEARQAKFALLTKSLGPARSQRLKTLAAELPQATSMRAWAADVDAVLRGPQAAPVRCGPAARSR